MWKEESDRHTHPILLGFNLVNSSIILSSDRVSPIFDEFVSAILHVIGDLKEFVSRPGVMYTSNRVSDTQEEIVFFTLEYAQSTYAYLLKTLNFDKLPPGVVFKESLGKATRENLTDLVLNIQQLVSKATEATYKVKAYYIEEPTPEMARMQEEVQVMMDLLKSQTLLIFKCLEAFCE